MADETVRIIRIETGGSEQTVKGLKDEINSLRDALLNTEKGTDEYKQVLEQLIADQQKLAEVMNAGKSQVSAATGSYNALVNQMTALKKVWRETTDEASRKELGNQIKGINDKLSKMDQSIGDYRRNVGNYTQSITAAFGSMGGAAKNMVGPLNSVKSAFSALSAHPIVGVITVLVGLLVNGLAKGFKSSEENMNKLKVAFSGFQAIGDAVTKLFQGLAGWIAKVADGAINLADKLGLLGPKFKERQEMMKKQIALEKQERDNIVKNAQLETEAAELRAKASDEENYTIEQRIQFLQEAQAKEQEQLELEKAILEQKAAQLEAQLALTESSGEELTKLNELKAQVIKVNAQIAQSQRSTNKEIAGLRRRALSEAQQANQARLSLEKDLIQQELNLAEEGSEEQLKLAKELRDKELEIQLSTLKQKIKNRKDYEKAEKLALAAYNKDIQNLEFDAETKRIANKETRLNLEADSILDLVKRAEAKFNNAATILEEKRQQLAKMTNKQSQEFIDLENDIKSREIALVSLQDNFYQALEQQADTHAKFVFETTVPLSNAYSKLIGELEKQVANLKQASTETDEAFAIRKKALKSYIADTYKAWHEAIAMEKNAMEEYTKLMNVYNKYNDETIKKWNRQTWLLFFSEDISKNLDKASTVATEKLDSLRDVIRGQVMANSDKIAEALRTELKNILTGVAGMTDEEFEKHPLFDWKRIFGIDSIDKLNGDALQYAFTVFRGNTEELKNIMTELFNEGLLPEETMNEYLQALQNYVDAEKAILQQRYQNWDDLAKGIADLASGIGDIYSIKLENEKKALEKEGKYTEQERKNLEQRYKTVQAMQIAEATINTISGAVAAFMKSQELGQPWGAIIGAVQAAAVTAAGVAQIMKIRQTNPYSDNSSSLSSSGVMSATVTPTVTDYTPEYSANLTGRSDTEYLNELFGKTRLVVSVSEINEVQNRVRVVESESQF